MHRTAEIGPRADIRDASPRAVSRCALSMLATLGAWLMMLVGTASTAPAQQLLAWEDAYEMPTAPPPMFDWQPSHAEGQLLPLESLYASYLAGPKETRLGTQIFHEDDQGALWDSTLGGRVGLLRGTNLHGDSLWQWDVEGAAILRLEPEHEYDLQAVDFRAATPLAFAWGPNRLKFAYSHLSAHIGDEYLIRNPDFERLNYVRDSLVLGYARYFGSNVRVYGEASWAFYRDIGEPWQFQVGYEYAPTQATGAAGAPFFAINGLLREEVDFGGTTTLHTGWAWREGRAGRLFRIGFFFQTGKAHLYEFYDHSETQIGTGVWYDF